MTDQLPDLAIDKTLQLRISTCTTLPTPPAVAMKVIALGDDPLAGLKDVVDAVRLDPALSAKILRVANSAMYARRHHAETLDQATMRLGFAGTITLALSFSMVNAMRQGEAAGLDMNHYWPRAVATAPGGMGKAYGKSPKPAVYITHGDADKVLPVANARWIKKTLLALGYKVTYIEFPGVGHVFPTSYKIPMLTWMHENAR